MGALAKKISCERFCVHKVVPEYVEYYKKIISQKK
jgi:hypothetical protein